MVGNIPDADTDVYVYIKNITTGRINRFEATSDGYGDITITVNVKFNQHHLYEVTITEATATNIGDTYLITLDGFETCCIYFRVYPVYLAGVKDTNLDATLSVVNCESTNTPSESVVTYHYTTVDYSVTANITAIGVDSSGSMVNIYLSDPTIYPLGREITVTDEANTASVNNIIIHAAFALGDPQVIAADGGSITFYRGENNEFIVTATN